MKKNVFKTIVICLAITLTASLLTGCGKKALTSSSYSSSITAVSSGSSSTAASTSATSSKTVSTPGSANIDLKGYVFKIADFNSNRWDISKGDVSVNATLINQAKTNVERKLNCKIVVDSNFKYGTNFQTFQPGILSGKKVADIIACGYYEVGPFVTSGLAVDVKTIPHIDLKSKYYDQNVQKYTTIGNKTYAFANYLYPQLMATDVIYFNKKLISDYHLENPYDLVRQNKWTYDKFAEMCKAVKTDLNGDGKFDDKDRYGLAAFTLQKGLDFFFAGGLNILQASGERVEYVLNNKKTIDTINAIKPIMVPNDLSYPMNKSDDWHKVPIAFANNQALFFLQRANYVRDIPEIINMKSDFGIVPVPKGPFATDYVSNIDWNMQVMLVPITAKKDLDTDGIIINELSKEIYDGCGGSLKNYYKDFCLKYFRDDESMQMVQTVHGGYDLGVLAAWDNQSMSDLLGKVFIDGVENNSSDIGQILATYDSIGKNVTNDYFNKGK